jgi:hypothetical protein
VTAFPLPIHNSDWKQLEAGSLTSKEKEILHVFYKYITQIITMATNKYHSDSFVLMKYCHGVRTWTKVFGKSVKNISERE